MLRKDINKNKNILLGVLIVGIISMTVAFAALSTRLNINGTANILNSWCVGFDNTKTNTYQITKGVSTALCCMPKCLHIYRIPIEVLLHTRMNNQFLHRVFLVNCQQVLPFFWIMLTDSRLDRNINGTFGKYLLQKCIQLLRKRQKTCATIL